MLDRITYRKVLLFLSALALTITFEWLQFVLNLAQYDFQLLESVTLLVLLFIGLAFLDQIGSHDRNDILSGKDGMESSIASEIASSLANIQADNRFVQFFVKEWQLRRFLADLKSIQNDQIVLGKEGIPGLAADFVKLTRERILAVSYMGSIQEIWDSTAGQKYLETQIEAAKRGVEVRRVFIFRSLMDFENFQKSPVFRQHEEEIETRITTQRVLEKDIERGGLVSEIKSMVLFDDEIGGEIETNPDLSPRRLEYKTNEDYLQQLEAYHRCVWGMAVDYRNQEAVNNLREDRANWIIA